MRNTIPVEPDPYRRAFKFPKWNGKVRVTSEPRIMRRLPEFQGWPKQRHETIALEYLDVSIALDRVWSETVAIATRVHGDGSGVLISGVYRDHYPSATKDVLRTLAHTATEYRDRSVAHWHASGRRIETWRDTRDRLRA